MLQPNNRLTLIDSMRPPAGFHLESAMAVTFTLDLRALLAAPAAFTLIGAAADGAGDSHLEPIDLLHALRTYAGKITVFNQVGQIALPPSRRVFAFLERSVVPVKAPLGGIVHPKVWVLRYEPTAKSDDGPVESRLRVLIASRNLTFDTSWDTVIRLDESADGSGADLSALADLFGGLVANSHGNVLDDHSERVDSLSSALHSARFTVPAGVDELHVHVLGLARTESPLPDLAARSLVISPFVGDDFLTSVYRGRIGELVSRLESLDALEPHSLGKVDSVYAFDDGSNSPDVDSEERRSAFDPGNPLVGLHAKVFAFEHDGRARLFLGSANATGAAFHNNVELLIELVGPTSALGVDRLTGGTEDEPGLRALFVPFSPSGRVQKPTEPTLADRTRIGLAELTIEGTVEESGAGWAVTYRSRDAVSDVDDAVEIHCWPLASPGNRRRVVGGKPLDIRFETSLEAISGFLGFEVVDTGGAITQFVVPVPLHGLPEQRDRLLLRALIGNAERFLRYLLALLNEDIVGDADLLAMIERATSDASAEDSGPLDLPVLEKLLQTMRRDPAKLAGLHPLVADLAADDALPPGFADLWGAIYDVAIAGGQVR
jgi:hypothetical protein